jgi:hypothetical protein
VSIPNNVTSIGNYAFRDCNLLTSLTIPSSIISIGDNAFGDCSGLTSLTIPNSVQSIGGNAFKGTGWYNNQSDGLLYLDKFLLGYKGITPTEKLNIAEGTRGIAAYAFKDCNGLTSVTIPNSVISVGERAFENCDGLISVTIPNGVTCIGSYAFSNCFGLTSVIIPNTVTSIESGAFYGCSGLTSLNLSNSVQSIGDSSFSGCDGLTSVTIPNSVISLGENAFLGCDELKSVTIGSGMNIISSNAFSYSTFLSDVYCLVDQISDGSSDSEGIFAAPNAFFDIYLENATLHVPASSIDAYKTTYPWCDFGNIVALTEEESDPSSIVLTNSDSSPYPIKYFNLDGKRISKPQRGLNIIKMSDGTTKKIFIK